MKSTLQRGKLTTWKAERGFGFITPDQKGPDVFLHITALQGFARRPKLGDTILYQSVIESNGKIRASKASIQGVISKIPPTRSIQSNNRIIKTVGSILTALAVIVLVATQLTHRRSRSRTSISLPLKPGCVVKGNISHTTGNKWYHLPGMKDYESTVINSATGERWFCSESEALEDGWRKAPR